MKILETLHLGMFMNFPHISKLDIGRLVSTSSKASNQQLQGLALCVTCFWISDWKSLSSIRWKTRPLPTTATAQDEASSAWNSRWARILTFCQAHWWFLLSPAIPNPDQKSHRLDTWKHHSFNGWILLHHLSYRNLICKTSPKQLEVEESSQREAVYENVGSEIRPFESDATRVFFPQKASKSQSVPKSRRSGPTCGTLDSPVHCYLIAGYRPETYPWTTHAFLNHSKPTKPFRTKAIDIDQQMVALSQAIDTPCKVWSPGTVTTSSMGRRCLCPGSKRKGRWQAPWSFTAPIIRRSKLTWEVDGNFYVLLIRQNWGFKEPIPTKTMWEI